MPQILIVALIVAGYIVVFLVLKARISRVLSPASVLREIRGEVDRIIAELNQTTDRNISLVEDRIRKVSELLELADKKIGLLRRESEKQEVATRVYSELKRIPARLAPGPGGSEAGEAARQELSTASEGGRSAARSRVVALHDQGISPPLIARQLGITLAEIELILSLAGKSRSS